MYTITCTIHTKNTRPAQKSKIAVQSAGFYFNSHSEFLLLLIYLLRGILFNPPTPLAPAVGSLRSPSAGAVRGAQSLCHVYQDEFFGSHFFSEDWGKADHLLPG
jgi:hypothetical protein